MSRNFPPADESADMSAVQSAAQSVLVRAIDSCVADGQHRIVGLVYLPDGGGELAGWLEAEVPLGAWRGWLVTGVGEVVWLPGVVPH